MWLQKEFKIDLQDKIDLLNSYYEIFTTGTEEEQIEAIKRWWKEKGLSTVFQVLVIAALYFGWQGWQKQQQQLSYRNPGTDQ
mgnify:CR=1 FL=1